MMILVTRASADGPQAANAAARHAASGVRSALRGLHSMFGSLFVLEVIAASRPLHLAVRESFCGWNDIGRQRRRYAAGEAVRDHAVSSDCASSHSRKRSATSSSIAFKDFW